MSAEPQNPPRLPPSTSGEANADALFHLIPAQGDPGFNPTPSSSGVPRLIVLIPNINIDTRKLAHALVQLGVDRTHELILLGNIHKRRTDVQTRFYRLAVDLRASGWRVRTHPLRVTEDWAEVVRQTAQPGDLIAVHAEYEGERLSQELAFEPGLSVYILSGVYPARSKRLLNLTGRGLFEAIPLAIILGMFWFQVQLSAQTSGVVNTLAIVMTLMIEIGLIFIWSLFLPSVS